MTDQHVIVAIYQTTDQADEAFSRLQADGSNMDQLSFVGRDYWEKMQGSRNAGKRFRYRGPLGSFWEHLWSSLSGWGVFWLFENGPVLIAGPLVRTIIATQEEMDGEEHSTFFEGALSDIGIPMDSLMQYEKALIKDQILVFIQGTLSEIEHVQTVLNKTKIINHTVHHNLGI